MSFFGHYTHGSSVSNPIGAILIFEDVGRRRRCSRVGTGVFLFSDDGICRYIFLVVFLMDFRYDAPPASARVTPGDGIPSPFFTGLMSTWA